MILRVFLAVAAVAFLFVVIALLVVECNAQRRCVALGGRVERYDCHTTLMTMSCGSDCWTTMPIETCRWRCADAPAEAAP